MKDDHQELIWVSKELAERVKKMQTEQATREQQDSVLNEYIESLKADVKRDFKCNLESLEEDAAIFTGLMLKVKQAFEKAKGEQLTASYELWEKFEAEIPSVNEKVNMLLKVLKPLKDELTQVNDLIGKIDTYDINRLNESVAHLASSYGKNKEMIEFLITNFGKQVHA